MPVRASSGLFPFVLSQVLIVDLFPGCPVAAVTGVTRPRRLCSEPITKSGCTYHFSPGGDSSCVTFLQLSLLLAASISAPIVAYADGSGTIASSAAHRG